MFFFSSFLVQALIRQVRGQQNGHADKPQIELFSCGEQLVFSTESPPRGIGQISCIMTITYLEQTWVPYSDPRALCPEKSASGHWSSYIIYHVDVVSQADMGSVQQTAGNFVRRSPPQGIGHWSNIKYHWATMGRQRLWKYQRGPYGIMVRGWL